MIIAGDIACPTAVLSNQLKKVFETNESIFKDKPIIFNFEGLIGDESLLQVPEPVLYNHVAVLDAFTSFSTVTACLANNHILDLPKHFNNSVALLKQQNIHLTGAGNNKEAAQLTANFINDKQEYFVFNECWDFLLYHQKNPTDAVYIATIQFHQLVKRVQNCKENNPQACIIVYLHWSLDLETLPYPMYRQFSKALIDAGATVVAGSHAHCVQGGEQYKDGFIIYGLGNFFIPNHVFANGQLYYPSLASTQLVFEYKHETKEAFCHWFKYEEQEGQHHLQHLESSPFQSSTLLQKYSPYQQMGHQEYIRFFKQNRRKKILIPLFKEYTNERKLAMLTTLLKTRATFARKMAKLNLIKWGS